MIKISKSQILNTYHWIKVPKYSDDPKLDWPDRLAKLETHHALETQWLIDFIRRMIQDGVVIDD